MAGAAAFADRVLLGAMLPPALNALASSRTPHELLPWETPVGTLANEESTPCIVPIAQSTSVMPLLSKAGSRDAL